MYDFHALVFRDKTIVDGCHINGHYQMGDKLVVGVGNPSNQVFFIMDASPWQGLS